VTSVFCPAPLRYECFGVALTAKHRNHFEVKLEYFASIPFVKDIAFEGSR
jgi:hypothetical protein